MRQNNQQVSLAGSLPEVVKLSKINSLIAFSGVSAEQPFTRLPRAKSYLRNSMGPGVLHLMPYKHQKWNFEGA